MKVKRFSALAALASGFFAAGVPVWAQPVSSSIGPFASNVVVPQARAFAIRSGPTVQITGVTVRTRITEQVATTTTDISLRNPSGQRIEAELMFPVPAEAAVRSFTFEGNAAEATAKVLPKEEARRTYEQIVAKIRDPALLEFVGSNLIRSSVFPVEANGTQKVRMVYEHLLPADGERVDYLLPRSESLDYHVPWDIAVEIRSKQPISTVYSPSHQIETTRTSANVIVARVAETARTEAGPFRLSYLLERDGVTASLLAYPDAKVGGGYFLLLAGLPARAQPQGGQPAIKREVILVLDRSGSMSGEKIDQVRKAAGQILSGLEDGEAFNIITYNETIDLFAPVPVVKSNDSVKRAREYLNATNARGGTNIHDALSEALRLEPAKDMLPIVLFLTDGLPTVGRTSEVTIRDLAIKSNPHQRRIFTFGVGVDVNTPLLQAIANESRATATFVLPGEDVELKVAQVFKRLAGPVLADAKLEALPDVQTQPRVREVLPGTLPDLFEGDQLVVLGQYRGEQPLEFRVAGNYLGRQRTFTFTFGLDKATTRNAFVPRLWASRKIGMLSDAARQLGANGDPLQTRPHAGDDPRLKEIVDEIVRLSTEFGILTEYTAFLAQEGTDLSNEAELFARANGNFINRALNVRTGLGACNQDRNNGIMMNQDFANPSNVTTYFDANMNRVSITAVQQVNDRAFYNRNGRWVDSRIVRNESSTNPAQVVEFGSEEFRNLAHRLARENRAGSIALRGDILMLVDDKPVLVKAPATP